MKSGAIEGWEGFPSYFDTAVPRILKSLSRHDAKITFFIVGQDADLEKNHTALRSISDAGHEIANHSFHHEPWLNRRSDADIQSELKQAHDAIETATGVAPDGFRGPGFSLSTGVLKAVKSLGYSYDASTFPTFIGPLARAYYFLSSGFDAEQREERSHLFGSLKDGLRTLKPFNWNLGTSQLLELPVTTIPVIRAPFHLSYIAFLAKYSKAIALLYFHFAIMACKIARVQPSLLLHPLDFMGEDDVPCLRPFPGMTLSSADKQELVNKVLDIYFENFDVLSMGDYATLIKPRVTKQETAQFPVDALPPLAVTPAEA